MLRFFLDEQIPSRVCEIVRRRGKSDETLLSATTELGVVLVTYDLRTIPGLIERWAAASRSHAGVIFIDQRTIWSANPAAIASSLITMWTEYGDLDWNDRMTFAARP